MTLRKHLLGDQYVKSLGELVCGSCMAGQECALDIRRFICAAFMVGKWIVIIALCINNTVTQL